MLVLFAAVLLFGLFLSVTTPTSLLKRLTGQEAWTDPVSATVRASLVNVTTSPLVLAPATHSGRLITLNLATGIAVTLPNATGTGDIYSFFIGTTITSTNVTTFTRGTALDVISGIAMLHKATSTYTPFLSAANTNTVTLGTNTNTTGGTLGDWLEFVDVGTNQWSILAILTGAGTLATPFSNT